jgi:hypothetical protein
MHEERAGRGSSYEVAVSGACGPAFLATFAELGAPSSVTSSVFLLAARRGEGLPEIVATLRGRELEILSIRRVGPVSDA